MGQTLSLSHSLNNDSINTSKLDIGKSVSLDNLNSIMLFSYDNCEVHPISIVDYLENALAYKVVLIIEPLTINPIQPTIVKHSLKQTKISDLVKPDHRISLFQLKNYKLYIVFPTSMSGELLSEMVSFLKSIDFSFYKSERGVMTSDLFLDHSLFSSVSAALKSHQAPLRRSAPSVATKNNSPCFSMRKSFETRLTFVNPPQLMINDIEEPDSPTEITPNLFVGGEKSANDKGLLKKLGITHIFNLNGLNSPSYFTEDFFYRIADIRDHVFSELGEEFWNLINFAKNVITNNGKIFVHCKMGISRSPAFCVAYLMDTTGIPYNEAFSIVQQKRPIVNINPGFEEQIKSKYKPKTPIPRMLTSLDSERPSSNK